MKGILPGTWIMFIGRSCASLRLRHSCIPAQRNPVKHGHVQCVTQRPYSSFHRYVREGVLTPAWAGEDLDGEFGEVAG